MNQNDILKKLDLHRQELLHFGVRKLILFGSFATDTASDQSDLDFLVELESKSFDHYMDLKFYLENLFHRRVDLVLLNALKKRIRPNIQKEMIHVPGF